MLTLKRLRHGRVSNRLAVFAAVLLAVTAVMGREPVATAGWASVERAHQADPQSPLGTAVAGSQAPPAKRTSVLSVSSLIFRF